MADLGIPLRIALSILTRELGDGHAATAWLGIQREEWDGLDGYMMCLCGRGREVIEYIQECF